MTLSPAPHYQLWSTAPHAWRVADAAEKEIGVVAYEDLGAEAIQRLVVENFPVVVVNDLYGGDLYREGRERWRRPVG
jgi:tartrate dehydratase beta subunit/fumarate hydratase class I family protein